MIKKYDLTPQGDGLYQIVARIPLPVHGVKPGTKGGLVDSPNVLDHAGQAWIGQGVVVTGQSYVTGNSLLDGKICAINITVRDQVSITNRDKTRAVGIEKSVFDDHATVTGPAVIRGSNVAGIATIAGQAAIHNSRIIGNATITGAPYIANSSIGLEATVTGEAHLDHCEIYTLAHVSGQARLEHVTAHGTGQTPRAPHIITGNAKIIHTRLYGPVYVTGGQQIYTITGPGHTITIYPHDVTQTPYLALKTRKNTIHAHPCTPDVTGRLEEHGIPKATIATVLEYAEHLRTHVTNSQLTNQTQGGNQ